MSILTWFRDKIYGKSYTARVEPQVTDSVTVKPVRAKVGGKVLPKKTTAKNSK
jgi:hypothetical protein